MVFLLPKASRACVDLTSLPDPTVPPLPSRYLLLSPTVWINSSKGALGCSMPACLYTQTTKPERGVPSRRLLVCVLLFKSLYPFHRHWYWPAFSRGLACLHSAYISMAGIQSCRFSSQFLTRLLAKIVPFISIRRLLWMCQKHVTTTGARRTAPS